jgi:hypothetical protein
VASGAGARMQTARGPPWPRHPTTRLRKPVLGLPEHLMSWRACVTFRASFKSHGACQHITPACVRVWRPHSPSHASSSLTSPYAQAAPRAGPSSRGPLLVEARVAVRSFWPGRVGWRNQEERELVSRRRRLPADLLSFNPSFSTPPTDPLPALRPQEGALLPPGRHRLPGPPGGAAAGGKQRER